MEVFDDVFDSLHPNKSAKPSSPSTETQLYISTPTPVVESVPAPNIAAPTLILPSPVVFVAPPTATPPPKQALASDKSLADLLPKNTALSTILAKLKANAAAKLKQSIEASQISNAEAPPANSSNQRASSASQTTQTPKTLAPTTISPQPVGSTAPLTTSLITKTSK